MDIGPGNGTAEPAAKRQRTLDESVEGPSASSVRCTACARPSKSTLESLPAELLDRIASSFTPNDIACTLRLLSRTLAAHFRSHTTVRLSQPVPHHAFVRRFGRWSAVRSLPLAQRRKLIALTAASGSVANLRVVAGGPGVTHAIGTAGCALPAEVFEAAAAAGQLAMCKELYDMGCPWERRTLEAAARRGDVRLVRAIVLSGCCWDYSRGLCAAAAGGNPAVLQALVQLHGNRRTYDVGGWNDGSDPGDSRQGDVCAGRSDTAAPAAADGTGEAAAGEALKQRQAPQQAAVEAAAAAAGTAADAASADAAAAAAAAAVDVAALHGLPRLPALEEHLLDNFLEAAAYGLALQPMAEYAVRSGALLGSEGGRRADTALEAALLSPTPDWRAKAAWLELQKRARARAAEAAGAAGAAGEAERQLTWECANLQRVGLVSADAPEPLVSLMPVEQLLERLAWARRRGYSVDIPPPAVLPLSDAAAMSAILAWVMEDPKQAAEAGDDLPGSDDLAAAAARAGHTGSLQALACEQRRALAAAAAAAGGKADAAVCGGVGSTAESGSRSGSDQQAATLPAAGSRVRDDGAGCDSDGEDPGAAPWQPEWVQGAVGEAAHQGHVEVLRWLVDTWGPGVLAIPDGPGPYDRSLWARAACAADPMPVFDFLLKTGCEGGPKPHHATTAFRHAAGDSGLRMVDWWQRHGLGGFEHGKALPAAAEGGCVQLCERLSDLTGHGPGPALWKSAVSEGRVELVDWLLRRGCPLPSEDLLEPPPPPQQSYYGRRRAPPAPKPRSEAPGTPLALYKVLVRNGDLGLLHELWERLGGLAGALPSGASSVPSIAGAIGFREAMYDTLDMKPGAPGGTGVSSPGSHSLPLIRFVLHHTAKPGSEWEESYLQGWTRFSSCALSRRSSLNHVGGSVAADAAMCDDWLGRLDRWLDYRHNLAKLADATDGCHCSLAIRLKMSQDEQGSERGGCGRSGRASSEAEAAGSRGASALALMSRHTDAAWESLAAAEQACRGEILCTLGEVKVWSPCAAGEDDDRDKEEEGGHKRVRTEEGMGQEEVEVEAGRKKDEANG